MKKMIVALDVKDKDRAMYLVEILSPYVDIFKVARYFCSRKARNLLNK